MRAANCASGASFASCHLPTCVWRRLCDLPPAHIAFSASFARCRLPKMHTALALRPATSPDASRAGFANCARRGHENQGRPRDGRRRQERPGEPKISKDGATCWQRGQGTPGEARRRQGTPGEATTPGNARKRQERPGEARGSQLGRQLRILAMGETKIWRQLRILAMGKPKFNEN